MYSKVFSQIFDSSIAEDYMLRHVFMDLLVLADPEGLVDMTHEAISRRTNIPIKIIHEKIEKLCLPDPYSRTKDENGRRLVPINENRTWGWRIVNYLVYRRMQDEDSKREYHRNYMRIRRLNQKNDDVKSVKNVLTKLRQAEGEENKEKKQPGGCQLDASGAINTSMLALPSPSVSKVPVFPEVNENIDLTVKPRFRANSVFVQAWKDAYRKRFGVEYHVGGGDEKAASRILALRGYTMESLLSLARKAWDSSDEYIKGPASTLTSFSSRLNAIAVKFSESKKPLQPNI